VRIIGIDPGLVKTGYGVIDYDRQTRTFVTCGLIKPSPKQEISKRLHDLQKTLTEILQTYSPDFFAIEETFVNSNPQSALKLGMARGVLMVTPTHFQIPVFEYAPNVIKKTLTGSGHATKEQMMGMMRFFFPGIQQSISEDAADALAIALCHAHHQI